VEISTVIKTFTELQGFTFHGYSTLAELKDFIDSGGKVRVLLIDFSLIDLAQLESMLPEIREQNIKIAFMS